MRVPRLRFSIGLLMAAVLVAGVAEWALIVRPRLIRDRQIVASQAEASYKQAKLVREVAEYAVKEYLEGVYMADKATIQGQIALAQSDRERAADRLRWSTEMKTKGLVPPATNIADQLTKQRADFDLEQAQVQLRVLEQYTKDKQVRSLKSDVEKARADETSRLATFQREKSRLGWLGF